MIVPKSMEERREEEDCGMEQTQAADPEGGKEIYKTAMKSIIKSSPFDRAMKVEAELNKLHGVSLSSWTASKPMSWRTDA